MQVSITGHTSGLGKSLNDVFKLHSYDVLGFSRSTGYDINSKFDRIRIIEESEQSDLFINNACSNFSQVELLYELYNSWKHKNKTIISIGSLASDAAEWRLAPCMYSTIKKALEVATNQLINSHDRKGCKLIIFKPGYLGDSADKISYSYASDFLFNNFVNNTFEITTLSLRSTVRYS